MKAIVGDTSFELTKTNDASASSDATQWLPATDKELRVADLNPQQKLIFIDGQKFEATLVNVNKEDKTVTLEINGKKTTVKIKEPMDDLLHAMGLDNALQAKVQDIKAPMPGLVLDILVSEGQTLEKGEKVLVLEAMKMENVIKSPSAGTVKRVSVSKGTAVDKNQVLIEMT